MLREMKQNEMMKVNGGVKVGETYFALVPRYEYDDRGILCYRETVYYEMKNGFDVVAIVGDKPIHYNTTAFRSLYCKINYR